MGEVEKLKQLDYWKMTVSLTFEIIGISVVITLATYWLLNSLYLWLTNTKPENLLNLTPYTWLTSLLFIIVFILILVAHEFIHGFIFKRFGGKPVYGAGISNYVLPYFYATDKNQKKLTRKEFIVISLAPLVVISLLGFVMLLIFPSISGFIILLLTMHTGGCIGDLWMVRVLTRYPKNILVQDDKSGFVVYGRPEDESLNIPDTSILSRFLKGFIISLTLWVLFLFFLPSFLKLLNIPSFTVGLAESNFTIFNYINSTKELSFAVGLLPPVVLGALSGVIYAIMGFGKSKHE